MKKLLLLLIFTLIIGSQLFSQTYRKLVEDGKTWITYEEMIDYHESRSFSFGADTVIEDKNYKKVNHYGFIREDDAKKVYFMNNALEEGLLYDFGANIGDTIPIVNTYSWHCLDDLTAVVDTIYYSNSLNFINDCNYFLEGEYNVNFLDDTERKIIIVRKLDSENQLDYWIEGVGSISGVLESGIRFTNCDLCGIRFISLLCHFEGDEPIFRLIWTCHLSSTIVVNNTQNGMSVYPNPVTENAFTIEFESPFTGNLFLINGLGNTVLNRKVNSNTTNITVNLPNIPAGLYYLMATDYLGNISTSKIIIN